MTTVNEAVPPSFMGRESFRDMAEFRELLRAYQNETGTAFIVRYAEKTSNRKCQLRKIFSCNSEYCRVTYVCVHNRRKSIPEPKQRRYYTVDCPAEIRLKLDVKSDRMRLTYVNLQHSHDTHVRMKNCYAVNRRLSEKEQKIMFRIMDTIHDNAKLRQFAQDTFSVQVTAQYIRDLRKKSRRFSMPDNGLEVEQLLQENSHKNTECKLAEVDHIFTNIRKHLASLGSRQFDEELAMLKDYEKRLEVASRYAFFSLPTSTTVPALVPSTSIMAPARVAPTSAANVIPIGVPSASTTLPSSSRRKSALRSRDDEAFVGTFCQPRNESYLRDKVVQNIHYANSFSM